MQKLPDIAPCTRPKPECAPAVVKGIIGSFYVYCPRCKSSAGTSNTPAGAIKVWNYWRELDKPKATRVASKKSGSHD